MRSVEREIATLVSSPCRTWVSKGILHVNNVLCFCVSREESEGVVPVRLGILQSVAKMGWFRGGNLKLAEEGW